MTYNDFKAYLAAFVQNSEAALTVGTVNIAELTINQARLRAQRDHDFMSLQAKGGLNVSDFGTSLDAAVTVPEGSTVSKFKTVRSLHQYSLNEAGTDWKPGQKYDLGDFSLMTRDSGVKTTISLYVVGRDVYSLNAGDTLWVGLIGIPFLEDIDFTADGSTSDIFTTYGVDWLLWECLDSMNGYLKEEERLPVSQTKKRATWDSFVDWDKEVESDYTNITALD